MKKKQLIRILIIEEDHVEAEWYAQSLRSTQFAMRAYLAKDTQSFEGFLNEQIYDLILFISPVQNFDLVHAVELIHKAGQDVPLVAICNGKDKNSLMEACNSAIQAGATAVVEKRNRIHLVHTVFKEINWLNDRRELKNNSLALYLKEEQCRQLSDICKEPIVCLRHGRLYYVNKEFAARFRITDLHGLDGKDIYDFVADDDKEAFREFLHSLDNHAFSPAAVEVNFVDTKDEVFTALAEVSSVSYHNEDLIQLLLTDESQEVISETVFKEAKKEAGNNKLLASKKTKSHPLKTTAVATKAKSPAKSASVVDINNKPDNQEKKAGYVEPVTGLYNSDYFYKALDKIIESTIKQHLKNTLLCIQHDNLGEVNSKYGVVKAKDILVNTASLLSLSISSEDIAARLADDIYGILLKNTDLNSAMQIAEKIIREQKKSTVKIDGKKIDVPLSVGVVPITGSQSTPQEIMANAFSACRTARKSSDKKVKVYSAGSEGPTHLAGTLHLTREILQAINKNLFRLAYQPIASMKGHEGEYYEVLLRMEDSNGNEVPTETLFIHAAEHKLVTVIDEWVMSTALKVLNIYLKEGRNLHFFINISAESANDKNILTVIEKYMKANEIAGERLIFEISEGSISGHTSDVLDFILGLKELGCKSAIKHAGSGLKSLEIADLMPVDYIKLDTSVVSNLRKDKESLGALKAITKAAHGGGKFCIADCLEEQSDLFVLFENDVDFAQGAYIQDPSEVMDFDFSRILENHYQNAEE